MIRRAVCLLSLLLLGACSGESSLTSGDAAVLPYLVSDLRLPPPPAGSRMGAAYLQFTNNSPEDIRITHISSPQLESVEMHETILKDDIARMAKLAEVLVPAGQSLAFEPGAKHLMLRYPAAIPQQVTLHFFAGDEPLLSVATVVGGD